jgi:hypothetical protein
LVKCGRQGPNKVDPLPPHVRNAQFLAYSSLTAIHRVLSRKIKLATGETAFAHEVRRMRAIDASDSGMYDSYLPVLQNDCSIDVATKYLAMAAQDDARRFLATVATLLPAGR